MKKAKISGYLTALAEDSIHPLQTRVRLILTPFTPNSNKQGIPRSEAENFIKSAINQPLKIRMTPYGPLGHDFATSIGPITSAEITKINDEDVIAGNAIIWRDEFPDVDTFLRSSAEEIHTSWEVMYSESEVVDGIEWLHGITFGGTCIVDTPSYRGKTPILAIAEEQMDELKKQLEALQTQFAELQTKYETATTTAAARIQELETQVNGYVVAEENAKAEQKKTERKEKLAEVVSEEELDFYLGLEDTVFDTVVAKLQKMKPATAEDKVIRKIPEPISSNGNYSAKDIADAYKKLKRGK